jgi:hypothetical protein
MISTEIDLENLSESYRKGIAELLSSTWVRGVATFLFSLLVVELVKKLLEGD